MHEIKWLSRFAIGAAVVIAGGLGSAAPAQAAPPVPAAAKAPAGCEAKTSGEGGQAWCAPWVGGSYRVRVTCDDIFWYTYTRNGPWISANGGVGPSWAHCDSGDDALEAAVER